MAPAESTAKRGSGGSDGNLAGREDAQAVSPAGRLPSGRGYLGQNESGPFHFGSNILREATSTAPSAGLP